jgi:hypothetical protein
MADLTEAGVIEIEHDPVIKGQPKMLTIWVWTYPEPEPLPSHVHSTWTPGWRPVLVNTQTCVRLTEIKTLNLIARLQG